jgi:hypothetical protein
MTARTKPKSRRRSADHLSPAGIRKALKPYQHVSMTQGEAKAALAAIGIHPAPEPVPETSTDATPVQPAQENSPAKAASAIADTPSKAPEETRGQATAGVWVSAKKHGRWLGWLGGEAAVAVATPLLTAAVDGLGVLIAAMTVYELWKPTEALADWLLSWPWW